MYEFAIDGVSSLKLSPGATVVVASAHPTTVGYPLTPSGAGPFTAFEPRAFRALVFAVAC